MMLNLNRRTKKGPEGTYCNDHDVPVFLVVTLLVERRHHDNRTYSK